MADDKDVDITVDPLFVGLTREATILGIPYVAFVIEYMVVAVIFLAVANPFYLLLIVPIHGVLYLISATNPHIFSGIELWLKTNGRASRNKKYWNAYSFSPKPLKRYKD